MAVVTPHNVRATDLPGIYAATRRPRRGSMQDVSTGPNTAEHHSADSLGAQLGAQVISMLDHEPHSEERAERKAAQARARAVRASQRAAARAIPPERDATYDHLGLAELRAHRLHVAEAEERIGYWQRVAAARLDAARGLGNPLDIARMRPDMALAALTGARAELQRATRRSLPALPSLATLWLALPPRPGDLGSDADRLAIEALETTVEALGQYQAALSDLAKAATAELIARYRQTPSDCLTILPA